MSKKDEGLYIPDWAYSKLLKEGKAGVDAITLYFFYYHTSNRQHSDTAKATRSYVKTGLGWGTTRFWRANCLLVKEKMVEKIAKKNETTGLISEWFVRLPFKASAETIERIQSTCPQMRTTGDHPHVLETHTVDGEDNKHNSLSKDRNINENSFQKGSPSFSQEYVVSTETLEGSPTNKRLFLPPENLSEEQVKWLVYESNLAQEDSWWPDEVYPPFKAYCLSKNRTFKTEDNFLAGCLEYGLNRSSMGIGNNKKY